MRECYVLWINPNAWQSESFTHEDRSVGGGRHGEMDRRLRSTAVVESEFKSVQDLETAWTLKEREKRNEKKEKKRCK